MIKRGTRREPLDRSYYEYNTFIETTCSDRTNTCCFECPGNHIQVSLTLQAFFVLATDATRRAHYTHTYYSSELIASGLSRQRCGRLSTIDIGAERTIRTDHIDDVRTDRSLGLSQRPPVYGYTYSQPPIHISLRHSEFFCRRRRSIVRRRSSSTQGRPPYSVGGTKDGSNTPSPTNRSRWCCVCALAGVLCRSVAVLGRLVA